jgi:PAS domain S-box-containing protein
MKKAVNDVFSRKVGHFEGEYHTVSTDITINIKADYSPNIAEDGTFLGGIGVFEDISERKKAEEAALEAEKKYRHIFENSPIGIFHFNDQGIVTHCNEKFLEIIGLKNKEEIIGFNMVTRIKDKLMRKAIRDVLSRKDGHFEGNYHTVISGKDTYIKADYSLNVADDGTFLGGIGIFEDISGRKKAEEALRLDESRLETLLKLNQMTNKTFKAIADFVQEEAVKLTQSKMGYLAFLNDTETVLSIYSWSRDVMMDCNVEKGEKKFDYLLESTGLWGEPVRQKRPIIVNDYENYNEFKRGYPKGHIEMKRYMSVPITEGGRVVGVAGVGNKKDPYNQADVRQLTLLMEGMWQMMEQKKAEDTLRRFASELAQVNRELSKANAELSTANEELKSLDRMKDEFLSNVSHEFKTPLTSIQGYSQLISDGTLGSVNDQQKKAADTVIRNSERLRKLVDSLLYISRAQAGKLTYSFSRVAIASIIDNSIQDLALQAEKKDITIRKDIGQDLPFIRGDRDKLIDVMVNLLDNAIKFTPAGGKIDMGVSVDKDWLHIRISDSGIGIPKDKIENLFERFYQVDSSIKRRYGGTGLGLYICKMIVEDHKGKIWVESEEGEGSTFHVLLPLE